MMRDMESQVGFGSKGEARIWILSWDFEVGGVGVWNWNQGLDQERACGFGSEAGLGTWSGI